MNREYLMVRCKHCNHRGHVHLQNAKEPETSPPVPCPLYTSIQPRVSCGCTTYEPLEPLE